MEVEKGPPGPVVGAGGRSVSDECEPLATSPPPDGGPDKTSLFAEPLKEITFLGGGRGEAVRGWSRRYEKERGLKRG